MKALAWKYYFWIILAFDMVSFVVPFERRAWEMAETLFFVVALVGLFGFCWKRRIIARPFWQIFFAAFLCWMPVYFTLGGSHSMPANLVSVSRSTLMGLIAVAVALHVPLIVGLYLYSFGKGIWEGE
jgi:hypothetical protein